MKIRKSQCWIQHNGTKESAIEIINWINPVDLDWNYMYNPIDYSIHIRSDEGWVMVKPGDVIVFNSAYKVIKKEDFEQSIKNFSFDEKFLSSIPTTC